MTAEGEIFHEQMAGIAGGEAAGGRSDGTGARHPSETVAGFLSAIAIFVSLVGIAWHPLRLILPSLAIALVASGMGSGKGRLQLAAVFICAGCLFLGLAVAVVTSHALW